MSCIHSNAFTQQSAGQMRVNSDWCILAASRASVCNPITSIVSVI